MTVDVGRSSLRLADLSVSYHSAAHESPDGGNPQIVIAPVSEKLSASLKTHCDVLFNRAYRNAHSLRDLGLR